MLDEERLTFVLQGENGIVSVDALVDTVRRISALIYHVQYVVNRGLKPRPWVVEKLSSSAPTITIRPSTAMDAPAVPTFIQALQIISLGDETRTLPPAFDEDALTGLRTIGQGLAKRGGLTGIAFSANGGSPAESARIDARIKQRVESVLHAGYWEMGAIEGRMDAVQAHRGRSFTVWDDVTGVPVRCPFPDGPFWRERVRNAFTSRVIVSGRVRYFGSGMPRSVEVSDLTELGHDPHAPKGSFGSLPHIIGDQDSVEYLRELHR